MKALKVEQLRLSATVAAAEEIALGHGDDDVDEAIAHHLLTYGPDDLTLGEVREIAVAAHTAATSAPMGVTTTDTSEGTRR